LKSPDQIKKLDDIFANKMELILVETHISNEFKDAHAEVIKSIAKKLGYGKIKIRLKYSQCIQDSQEKIRNNLTVELKKLKHNYIINLKKATHLKMNFY
jgi:hypothetical protein